MNIKRFGEQKIDDNYNAFIEYIDGTKEDCNESTIEALWWSWITSKNAIREDKDGYNIFGYKNAENYKQVLLEGNKRVKELI